MKRLLYTIVCLTTAVAMQAQTVKERIEAVTDKDLYLSGEQMAIKLYTTDENGQSISFSRVAYVELNGDRENNLRLKVEMNRGQGQAVVKLPYTLATGTYQMTAYTRWMRNEGEKVFFNKRIGIFNPIRHNPETDQAILTDLSQDVAPNQLKNKGYVTAKTDKATYGPRQTVTLDIEGMTPDIQATIAVVRMDGLNTNGQAEISLPEKTREAEPCLPEQKGMIVEGIFTPHEDADGTPVKPNLTVQGNQINYYAGQTDPQGRVIFNTPILKGMTETVTAVQQGGHITLASPFVATIPAKLQPLTVSTAWQKALTERSIALQATEHYYEPRPTTIKEIEGFLAGTQPHQRYDLDQYRRFATFEETFMEFMPGVSTKGSKGNRHIVVFDAFNDVVSDSKRNTLVLLDGVAIMDHELILAYNPYLVKYVETYIDDFVFGNQLYNGILFLKTPNLKLSGFDLPRTSVICEYEGIHPQTDMYLPSATEDMPTHMPDLRHTLYWNPNVTAKDSRLTFRTSDMRGTYIVKIEGRTKNGEKMIEYASFEVQ